MAKLTMSRKKERDTLISSIEVEELFHTYSYSIKLAPTPGPESGKLILLYGSNGSGKTTILNLLYHLLHPEPYDGHRSYLGSVPFKSFRVHLLNGTVVSASRETKADPGAYELRIKFPRKASELTWTWVPELQQSRDDPDYEIFCSCLENLGLSFHYLRDSRRVEDNHFPDMQIPSRIKFERTQEISHLDSLRALDEQRHLSPEFQLNRSVKTAIQWFRQRALSATNLGYTSVNTIYQDIIKRIVEPGESNQNLQNTSLSNLGRELKDLRKKNSTFVKFGLMPELKIKEIESSLEMATPQHLSMLNTVLGPYLEGHSARLDALEELQRVMSSFVSLLCQFYSHKKVSVHLEKGLNITTDTGKDLEPGQLSSGEKQLLLLFCNAISSRKDKTILIIDEPEISLNVMWQRELIPALLTCLAGTGFQLIIATHSVEILARYRNYVAPLDNKLEL